MCERKREIGLGVLVIRGDIGMCVRERERDRLGGVSGKGRHRDVCV